MRVHPRRGSSYTTFALMLPVLLGFLAMGVDWGLVSVARFQTQAAADEAALAGASVLATRPTNYTTALALATTRASQYASRTTSNGITPSVSSVEFGYYNAGAWETPAVSHEPNAVAVVAETIVEMPFSAIFGVRNVTVRAAAKAAPNVVPGRAPDLVIVQDVTPSMSSTDLTASRVANQQLIDCVERKADPSTRGAFVRFANKASTPQPLVSYEAAPGALYGAVANSGNYNSTGICVGGYCTNHASGLFDAIAILNNASAPPPGTTQAIIMVTDGAPYTGGAECSTTLYGSTPGSRTPFQAWAYAQCQATGSTPLDTFTNAGTCQNGGGFWVSSNPAADRCESTDNGTESGSTNRTSGVCTAGAHATEAACEAAGRGWRRTADVTLNPSTITEWTTMMRDRAAAGVHGPIDVYAVYYSRSHPADAYHTNAMAYLRNHVVRGKGADLGVLDAPNDAALQAALADICFAYTQGGVGLLE